MIKTVFTNIVNYYIQLLSIVSLGAINLQVLWKATQIFKNQEFISLSHDLSLWACTSIPDLYVLSLRSVSIDSCCSIKTASCVKSLIALYSAMQIRAWQWQHDEWLCIPHNDICIYNTLLRQIDLVHSEISLLRCFSPKEWNLYATCHLVHQEPSPLQLLLPRIIFLSPDHTVYGFITLSNIWNWLNIWQISSGKKILTSCGRPFSGCHLADLLRLITGEFCLQAWHPEVAQEQAEHPKSSSQGSSSWSGVLSWTCTSASDSELASDFLMFFLSLSSGAGVFSFCLEPPFCCCFWGLLLSEIRLEPGKQ